MPADDAERWIVRADPVTAERRRAWEAIMTVGDGHVGSRGLSEVSESPSWPGTFVAGVYDDANPPRLLGGPLWMEVDLVPDHGWRERAELDLRTGVVTSSFSHDTGRQVSATRFSPPTGRGIGVLRLRGPTDAIATRPLLHAPGGATVRHDRTDREGVAEMVVAAGRGSVATVARQSVADDGPKRCVTRIAATDGSMTRPCSLDDLDRRCVDAVSTGYDALLIEHRAAWARRWSEVGTVIDGAPVVDRGLRLATFHLLSCATGADETAIGARALTGTSYGGHVFWDADCFVVPALAALAPDVARAALMYRRNRLDSASDRAREQGCSGARFPWESAHTGEEVTPHEGRTLHGETFTIRTGELEEHITADVAWAVMHYVDWTGDDAFLRDHGAPILASTARYWYSRTEVDGDGTAHIRGVIGPDEYHEDVDDNAFTNVMARYNLRVAADVCSDLGSVSAAEARRWRTRADAIVDGYDPSTSLYAQFRGFHDLEATLVESIGRAPLPADTLLGRDRVQQMQIVKQPDVLMLFHLVPDEVHAGSLGANLDHYLPRTAHGSSLSPAICAGLLARADRPEDAQIWFELAARLDLDDLGGTTAGGVHIATMGGLWQAVHLGVLGVRARCGVLVLDPCVPDLWGALETRFSFRGTPLTVHVEGDRCTVSASAATAVAVAGEWAGDWAGERSAAASPPVRSHHTFRRTDEGWERR